MINATMNGVAMKDVRVSRVNQNKDRNAKDDRSDKDDDAESFKDHISPTSGTMPYG